MYTCSLWSCWIVQTIEGVFCIILGMTTIGLDAPHPSSVGSQIIDAWTFIEPDPIRVQLGMASGWTNISQFCTGSGSTVSMTMPACDTAVTPIDDALRACLSLKPDTVSILKKTAPDVGGFNCISNANQVLY